MTKSFKNRKIKSGVILLFIFIFILFIFYKLDRELKPVMMALCDAEARIIATETINGTIREEFGNKISYDDIMNIKTDKDGNIVMIQANTVELNRIGSDIALSVQNRIQSIGARGVKIPLGLLAKNDLFAYYGPKITFKMQPVGSVVTSYRSEFQAAGINQTRHIVYLDVKSTIQVVIPLARNMVTVTSNIPIAESIIVGKVPNTYANIDGVKSDGITNQYTSPNK
ncbi:sporulation protein YunB [Caloramator quimbayensis]|uniref:Sporulation protein YunB n=1 Tax=Caloramator quimbayensis TaxID=1147123 RepID=A0A1T4WQE8_9CLOT|nr:sporulation protein YunB [Caloramator quimbayensis]SKA79584.1 sporulation protein YunB [Caloramator quimbayensis]